MPDDLDWRRGINCPNEWIYGKAGVGKSFKARRENPGFYTKLMSELWEGYDNQDVVILEDMDPFHVKLGYHLKIWADRYAFRARVLYGSIVARPKKIIVTSQYHPSEIWGEDSKTAEAICDRFKLIHLEKIEDTDGTRPKKKPTLYRSARGGALEDNNNCFKAYKQVNKMGPHLNMLTINSEIIRKTSVDDLPTCKICTLAPCICALIEESKRVDSDSEDLGAISVSSDEEEEEMPVGEDFMDV